jgi:hypothetical protein
MAIGCANTQGKEGYGKAGKATVQFAWSLGFGLQ